MASNAIAASPNVNASSAPTLPASAAAIGVVFTEPSAWPDAVMSMAGPQAAPVHVRIEIVGTVPPFDRSYVISLSPVVRRGVSGVTPTPLFAQFVGVAAGSQVFWFSSKSMFVVPDGFWTRDQNSSRNWGAVAPSAYSPNVFRSLLLGGIEPVTTVGLMSFSCEPWPNELSGAPVGRSFVV